MNHYSFLYLSFMCLCLIKNPAFSQSANITHPSFSPSVRVPPGLLNTVFSGNDDNPTKEINCYIILYEMPGYQNAQAQGACYEAQTACLRLGLLQQFLQPQKQHQFSQMYPGGIFSDAQLKEHVQATVTDVKVKLVGCVLAAAASIITDSVIDQAGFLSPVEEKERGESALITSPPTAPIPDPSQSPVVSSSESSLQPLPQDPAEISSGEQQDPLPPLPI